MIISRQTVLTTYDDDLLVFVDETGHEKLAPGGGLFGLGGVIVYGADYARNIAAPWSALRTRMGIPAGRPLHASRDKPIYSPYIAELAEFFRSGVFIRHASIVTLSTETNVDPFIAAACGGLFRNMGRALTRVVSNSPIGRVVYILEHSERLQSEYQKLVGQAGPVFEDSKGNRQAIPARLGSSSKNYMRTWSRGIGLHSSRGIWSSTRATKRSKRYS